MGKITESRALWLGIGLSYRLGNKHTVLPISIELIIQWERGLRKIMSIVGIVSKETGAASERRTKG